MLRFGYSYDSQPRNANCERKVAYSRQSFSDRRLNGIREAPVVSFPAVKFPIHSGWLSGEAIDLSQSSRVFLILSRLQLILAPQSGLPCIFLFVLLPFWRGFAAAGGSRPERPDTGPLSWRSRQARGGVLLDVYTLPFSFFFPLLLFFIDDCVVNSPPLLPPRGGFLDSAQIPGRRTSSVFPFSHPAGRLPSPTTGGPSRDAGSFFSLRWCPPGAASR